MKTLTIGRDSSNHVVINDSFISRQHAQLIIFDNGQVLLKDLGSANGTFVNGNRIQECYLQPRDIVKFAGTFFDWQKFISAPVSQQPNSPIINQVNNPVDESGIIQNEKTGRGLGVAALVLGILGLILAFVPCINVLAFPCTILAIIFGAVGLNKATKTNSPKGMALTGLILGCVSLMGAILVFFFFMGGLTSLASFL
jgi:hypothetical protein